MVGTAFRVLSRHVNEAEKSIINDNYNYAMAA